MTSDPDIESGTRCFVSDRGNAGERPEFSAGFAGRQRESAAFPRFSLAFPLYNLDKQGRHCYISKRTHGKQAAMMETSTQGDRSQRAGGGGKPAQEPGRITLRSIDSKAKASR